MIIRYLERETATMIFNVLPNLLDIAGEGNDFLTTGPNNLTHVVTLLDIEVKEPSGPSTNTIRHVGNVHYLNVN